MSADVFVFPLSFAQERLWFLDQVSPGNAFYNIHHTIYFDQALKVEAIERSINAIIERHEILRSSFSSIDGQPVQLVVPSMSLPLKLVDLTDLPEHKRESELLKLSLAAGERPFDLTQAPLFRVTVVHLAELEYVLLVTMHHIISDGWSIELFERELRVLCENFAAGQGSPLPELPIQYADFAVWQKTYLRGEVLEQQLSYWRKQLEGAPTVLELPGDRARPPVQTFRGANQWSSLGQALTDSLKSLSRREGVTLFMTLLAAFKILIYRYAGQHDIVVGSPIAGRNRAEVEGLIGFFVNTLVLRTQLAGDLSFRQFLERVRETTLGAYAHQDLPFEKLVEVLHPTRDLSRNPLVQVMFALQNTTRIRVDASDGSEFSEEVSGEEYVESGTAKFDLSFALHESEGGLNACVEYSTDLFDDQTIARMLKHFRRLLEGIVANPDEVVSRLPLLTCNETHRLLVEWNKTGSSYPRDSCIQELFELHAERTPDAIAAQFAGEQLTYAELNRRANQLARRMRLMGVGPEVLVGVCLERSLTMVIGLLAILKAGGAYVPLDPENPKARLAFILEDTGATILVTQKSLETALPESPARILFVDDESNDFEAESGENLPSGASAENVAFVIYTSGSTGKPKGVLITHRAVNRLVCNTNYIDVNSSDRLAFWSNISFDAATFEIWGALLNGAALVGLPRNTLLSPQLLARQIAAERLSILFLTTALFNQVVTDAPHAFRTVKHVLFGGETAVPTRVGKVVHGPNAPQRLLHVYGPTETTTYASWYLVREVSDEATSVPIGWPVGNTQLYILDSNLEPVPVGITGELYIGGDGLARAYHQRPDLTAEKFIPDCFSQHFGARLYKSGDLGRYLPDGRVEFLGRRDHQVKIRGFRVEPEEIETVLRQYPEVKDAVVVVREDESGNKRLVAYAAGENGFSANAVDLRNFLRGRIPEYMVPGTFVFLDHFALTANGKIDRKALPEAPSTTRDVTEKYVAPQTEMERTVADIWAEVLGRQHVGVSDNFFDLGGHSLLIIRVHSKIRETFMQEIPIVELFRHPTVAALSEYLSTLSPAIAVTAPAPFHGLQARADRRREAAQQRSQKRDLN